MKIEKINELFGRFAERLLKMRWMTLGIFALVIILSVIGMKRMVKETSFDDYFIEDDPMLVKTEEFKSHFGNDYYVGVLTHCVRCTWRNSCRQRSCRWSRASTAMPVTTPV